jgi:hypothetical protein
MNRDLNPYTHSLAQGTAGAELSAFIELWDRMEALVIAVYRGKAAGPAELADYATLRPLLLRHYPTHAARLRPHWRQATVQGRPLEDDPFEALLEADTAARFIDNWAAMQELPAAREAINRLLLDEK